MNLQLLCLSFMSLYYIAQHFSILDDDDDDDDGGGDDDHHVNGMRLCL
jgi:hypothetical protein